MDHCSDCGAIGYFPTFSNESGDWAVCPICSSEEEMDKACPECSEVYRFGVVENWEVFHWLILGGESGGKEARPFELEGVRHNIAEAKAATIAEQLADIVGAERAADRLEHIARDLRAQVAKKVS